MKELKPSPLFYALCAIAAVAVPCALYAAFVYAPVEKQMGFVQKIFYFHVPSAMMMFLATAVCAVGSVGYLINRKEVWDRIGDTGVELAILFGAMVMISKFT